MRAAGADGSSLFAGSEPLGDLEHPFLNGNIDVGVGERFPEFSTRSLDIHHPVLDSGLD